MRLLKDLTRKRKVETRKKVAQGVAIGTLIGSIIGGTAGILLAPDSGKNTRKKIGDNTKAIKNRVEKNIDQTKEQIQKNLQDKKEQIQEAVEKIKCAGRTMKKDVSDAIDSVKESEEDQPKEKSRS